jgi:hypothetical protein
MPSSPFSLSSKPSFVPTALLVTYIEANDATKKEKEMVLEESRPNHYKLEIL